jgi:pimeloyl-ACP methyl ester carboxylesterase
VTPTYVFVHGSGSNAGSWSKTQQEMALRGHRTIAVDLPGRGAGFCPAYYTQDLETFAAEPSVLTEVTAEQTVGHVVDVVRRLREHGPVVLVGHSLAGLTMTAVGNTVPELLDRIVYVAAQCPVDSAAADYLTGPEWATTDLMAATAPILVGNPLQTGFIRLNWRGAGPKTLAALKAAIGADLTDEEFGRAINGTQPDEVFWQNDPAWTHRADKDTWGRIPRTFIRTADDRAMPPAAQDRYIREADALTPENPFEVHTIKSSHSGFLRRPHEVVDILTRSWRPTATPRNPAPAAAGRHHRVPDRGTP